MDMVLPLVAAVTGLLPLVALVSGVVPDLYYTDSDIGVPIDSYESFLLPEPHPNARSLDDSFDTLVVVREADGSSRLGVTDDIPAGPVLGAEGTLQIQETVVDGPLLDVLLTVNGLDHSLLALSRMDASLLGATAFEPQRCDGPACRETCVRHHSPGGYCDKLRRCRCFAVAGQET